MRNRQRRSRVGRVNRRKSYRSGGPTSRNLGTNGSQLSNNPSKLNRGGRIRKMEHGGMHNDGCPAGQHMENGQCVSDTIPSGGGNMGGGNMGGGYGYRAGGMTRRKAASTRRSKTSYHRGGQIRRRRRR